MLLELEQKNKENILAIDSSENTLSYGELIDFCKDLSLVIPPRSFVFLLANNDVGGIAWTMGCLESKVVPLLLGAQMDTDLLKDLFKLYTPDYLCVSNSINRPFKHTLIYEKYDYRLYHIGGETVGMHPDLSHLLPTSGSTGSPKLVRHSYSNIEAAGLNISSFFKIKEQDRALMVLPLFYTMGLSMLFSHIKVGATLLITDLNMTDSMFWTFLKEKRATSFTGVPYSFKILNLMRFFNMKLPHLELLTQGGGRLEHELNIKFAEYCRDNNMRWIATYGQTEGSARMAYLPPEYAISKAGSIGVAVPNGELSLIDDQGDEISESFVEGEMCYKGKNVTMGYAFSSEDLKLGDKRSGFLKTGDIAYRDNDGCYYIVGRKGRFLKLFGVRIGLDECEQIVTRKFDTECACIGDDSLMIVFVTSNGIEENVKKELINKTGLAGSAFQVKQIDAIPRNNVGKIQYNELNKINNKK